jgi:hypothetical protein
MEQAALRLLGKRTWQIDSPELKHSVERITEATGAVAAFLLYTGYYKETVLVGPVQSGDGAKLFVKCYQQLDRAIAEVECATRVQSLAGDYFRLARVVKRADNIVAYELLPHGRRAAPLAAVQDAAAAMGRNVLERCTATRATDNLIGEGFVDLGGQFSPELAADLRALRDARIELAWPECHGDLTPWNVFMNDQDQLCLIDYERAGRGPPLADLFHLHTQPAALVGKHELAFRSSTSAARDAGFDAAQVRWWYVVYLALQLEVDLKQWFVEGRRHHQLKSLITSKAALLARTLHASE